MVHEIPDLTESCVYDQMLHSFVLVEDNGDNEENYSSQEETTETQPQLEAKEETEELVINKEEQNEIDKEEQNTEINSEITKNEQNNETNEENEILEQENQINTFELINKEQDEEEKKEELKKEAKFQNLLTESVLMDTNPNKDEGLHLSKYLPKFAERIHTNIQEGIQTESEGFSILKAAPSSTFILPDLSDLSDDIKEFIDKDLFQKSHLLALEKQKIINWKQELTKLRPLMTQGDGNCLMHAVSLGMFGVHDRQLHLRNALHQSLSGKTLELFKNRWLMQAKTIDRGSLISSETLEREWNMIVEEASPTPTISNSRKQFKYLGQMHVFIIAHILRRPIIVYGESKARDIQTDESIFELPSSERMDGIYLPLLLPIDATRSDPLVLSFHSSHFAPLVAMFPDFKLTQQVDHTNNHQFDGFTAYYPIVDFKGVQLPVHYLDIENGETPDDMIKKWLTVSNQFDIPCAEQFHSERPEFVIALLSNYIKAIEPIMKEEKNKNQNRMNFSATTPCLGGCGFTGSSATKGLCSLCFKKSLNVPVKCRLCSFFANGESGLCSVCEKKQGSSSANVNFSNGMPFGLQDLSDLLINMQSQNNVRSNICKAFGCTNFSSRNGFCNSCFSKVSL